MITSLQYEIIRYREEYKSIWNEFVANSKNGFFLFNRDYMDYHSDRFCDHSLMFFKDSRLIAILPANIEDNILYSHKGLTYGGIISDHKMKTLTMIDIFNVLKQYLKSHGIFRVIYKAIPYIYHLLPAEEDLYALYINNANLVKREPSSVIYLKEELKIGKKKLQGIKKSIKKGIEVKESNDYDSFMSILSKILEEKYDTYPTHTVEEIKMLASRFPENIKLYGAYLDDVMLAGIIGYESQKVLHAQYGANSDNGRKLKALESIYSYLFNSSKKEIFDYGISTEKNGRYLNVGLIQQKEEYGARTVTYDTYEMEIVENESHGLTTVR